MNENNTCPKCGLYVNGSCVKYRKNGKCQPSTRDWFKRDKYDDPMSFIPVDHMCRQSSIFGNEYIGLTESDIERLKNGEVIHIPGEYGTFIGFIPEKENE